MSDVLVLAGGRALSFTSWKKAVVWVAVKRVAEVVEEYPDRYVNGAEWSVKMPSIVRLLRPIEKKTGVRFSRRNIYIRDRGRCQYCEARVPLADVHQDHVVPRTQGGKTTWTNVVVSCLRCNQRKGGRTPEQAGMKLHTAPVRPKRLDAPAFELVYRAGMPDSWKDWLRTTVYWEGSLEEG